MGIHRFHRDGLPVTRWKNGLGTTREIASWPPGASMENFAWRASIASIVRSGPFSMFAGVDRTIVWLGGQDVRLHTYDAAIDHRFDRAHAPFSFSGDVPLAGTLLGGHEALQAPLSPSPCSPGFDTSSAASAGGNTGSSDFNVMSRRGRCRSDVRVLDAAQPCELAAHGLLMSLCGTWRIERSHAQGEPEVGGGRILMPGEGIWWADTAAAWQVAPLDADAKLVAVRWTLLASEPTPSRPAKADPGP